MKKALVSLSFFVFIGAFSQEKKETVIYVDGIETKNVEYQIKITLSLTTMLKGN